MTADPKKPWLGDVLKAACEEEEKLPAWMRRRMSEERLQYLRTINSDPETLLNEAIREIDALKAEVQGAREGTIRAYHVTLDSLDAPPDEWPCNRVKKLVAQLTTELREKDERAAEQRGLVRDFTTALENKNAEVARLRERECIGDFDACSCAYHGQQDALRDGEEVYPPNIEENLSNPNYFKRGGEKEGG